MEKFNPGVPSDLVAHAGIPLILAYLLRLNPIIAVFCGMLPDLVDKPLSYVFEMGGRYIAHTLLFVLVVSIAFALWRRRHGLAAFIGGISHLVIDWSVPWFYPFKEYSFRHYHYDIPEFFDEYFRFSNVGIDLIWMSGAAAVVFVCLWLARRYSKRRSQRE
ncbi:MAG: metal-dependent hydrolase [Chloroflexi bacterium]|nr:metal-dependent hydrolase [Chloroflexota bacterium]